MIFDWDRTRQAEERLNIVDGTYAGRHVISRDTPIDKGVYIGANAREAIVVDSFKDDEIKRLYEKVKYKLEQEIQSRPLQTVYDTVLEEMPHDEFGVSCLLIDKKVKPDQKVPLGFFIKNHKGVCRHQALTTGVLLELLKKDRIITGRASIDRNERCLGPFNSAHVWVRYITGHTNEIYIIDAGRFLGTLEESLNTRWNYLRPGEIIKAPANG